MPESTEIFNFDKTIPFYRHLLLGFENLDFFFRNCMIIARSSGEFLLQAAQVQLSEINIINII